MKKHVKLTAILLILASLFLLVSCGGAGEDPAPDATVTLVLEDRIDGSPNAYTVRLSDLSEGDGIIPLLAYVSDTYGLAFEMDGTMISKIGAIENNADAGEWIYVYTTVTEDVDVSEYRMTVEYQGMTITSSGVGATDMRLKDGAIIYIGLITF